MDLSDADALGRLYGFTVDVEVFGDFVASLQEHIEVSSPRHVLDLSADSVGTTPQSHL
jgi:hypothetical protein